MYIWVKLLPTTVTLNLKSSANAHYRQIWCRHSASHCGTSSLFCVPRRCAYTMLHSCLCCLTAQRPGHSLYPSPPGLTSLTVELSCRILASTGATSFPMKRCGPLLDSPGLFFGCPPPGPLVWTSASLATAPFISGYPGHRPWHVRLETTSRGPTHPLVSRGQLRSSQTRPRYSRNWTSRAG